MSTIDNMKQLYTELLLESTAYQTLNAAKVNEISQQLTLAGVTPSVRGFVTGSVISASATGNADSSVFDWGNDGPGGSNFRPDPVLVRISTTAGATPTCTYAIQGSTDGSTYTALTYADTSAPTTFAATTFSITSSTATVKMIKPGQVYRYLKVVYSLNTNMTNDTDVYPLGGDQSSIAVA
jgi:hypothetical protein